MCWVLLQDHDGILTAVDEIVLNETNTYEACARLKKRLPPGLEVQFYGDASGRARKTSAVASDWDIIMQKFAGASIFVPRSNPPVERRTASVNAALRNGKLKVDARCKTLIRDLESLAYKPGSPVFDLRDPRLGHISDALGYCVYTRMPIQAGNPLLPQDNRIHVTENSFKHKDLKRYGNTKPPKVSTVPASFSIKR
jgi:hypothetical protein